ncbi:MAG: UvrD-helicase domain-containing protein [Ignavibacteriaceae bacterium]|nr:UvrD-helicase domain-containing protein [Ignavibacteriaceae bacterium]
MMNLLTPHQSKALDHKKHISLTANAGSGKTFVLSKRYLEIAITEGLSLRNIAAITFTDKAAGELYQKIAKEIEIQIHYASDQSDTELLEKLRHQLVSANISTIHSFCTDILREHPVEAEIDANFTPIDEVFSEELIELSIEELFKKSVENAQEYENLKYLIRLFSSPQILKQELSKALKHRRNLIELSKRVYNLSPNEIANYFFKTFLAVTEEILRIDFDEFVKAATKINSTVMENDKKNPTAALINSLISKLRSETNTEKILNLLCELKEKILVKSGTIAKKGYLSSSIGSHLNKECSIAEAYLNMVSNFEILPNHNSIEIELAKFGLTFNDYFRRALEIYSSKKKEAGYLDYEDILLLTHSLLQNDDVKKDLSAKYKYIMIDEYQDTNELQYNIFLPILNDLKTGNLFVVGDEKQSIYMFRDAELEIFEKTKNKIGSVSGSESQLTLPDSFRMAPQLCVFINTLFRNLFNMPNSIYNEVHHEDIICARNDGFEGIIEILLSEATEEIHENEAEANLIANRIIKLIQDGTSGKKILWGDIAILCRKRKSFLDLEKVFSKKSIPFTIVGGKGFYQRQSVYDIFNYFSFLLDQKNDTALIGILRSPFFTISDKIIFEISLMPGSIFWQKLQMFSVVHKNLIPVVEQLNENIALINQIEIPQMLRKIVNETGYLAVLNQKTNAQQEQANFDKLINITLKFCEEDFRTLYDYVNYLKDAIETVEDESQAVISDELNSVKIMTIHQSKGLEFPYVFLFKCGESIKRSRAKSKSIVIDKSFGILTPVPLNDDYFGKPFSAPIVGLSNFINEKKSLAEMKRLFYVAITRAKDGLFLSASKEQALSGGEHTFIGMLKNGLSTNLENERLIIKDKLKHLTLVNNNFTNIEKDLEVNIPIISKLEEQDAQISSNKLINIKNDLISGINDLTKGEILSATKFSIYEQCPLKYSLVYELGYSNLMQEINYSLKKKRVIDNNHFDLNVKEDFALKSVNDEEKFERNVNSSQLKGKVIHQLLSEEVTNSNLIAKVEEYFADRSNLVEIDSNFISELKTSIVHDLKNYFDSDNYKWNKSFENYKNEAELYYHHRDYYLYGIIDKIILNGNQIIIIDYKTDLVTHQETAERAEHYFSQLKFYAYLASKLYGMKAEIELRLIFIKHPNQIHNMIVKQKMLEEIEKEIETAAYDMKNGKHVKNLKHCKFCIFSINNSCIVT